jgi:hypothetical protein
MATRSTLHITKAGVKRRPTREKRAVVSAAGGIRKTEITKRLGEFLTAIFYNGVYAWAAYLFTGVLL